MNEAKADTADVGLRFLWLEITGKCNLSCTHCYADSGPQGNLYGNMAYGDWERVLDEAAGLGCRSVQFIGGEPTMHPRLVDLVDHANNRRYNLIEVFSNVTRLSQELLNCFQRNRVRVATSFYSHNPDVHERVTQVKGSWRRTVDGIHRVLEAGLLLRVGVIDSNLTAAEQSDTIDFLIRLGVENVGIDRTRGVGRGLIELGRQGIELDQLCGQCWKGKLCVTPTGNCYPCVMARASSVGSVHQGLASIVNGCALRSFRQVFRDYIVARRVRPTRPLDAGCSPFQDYLHQHNSENICTPDNCAPDNCTPYNCAPDNCTPYNCAPDNCTPYNCAPDNCTPYNCAPDNCTPASR